MAIESPLTQTTTGCFEEPAANVTSEVREVAGRLPDNLRSKNVPCFRRGYRIEARAWLLSAALHSLSGSAADRLAIESSNRLCGFVVVRHFHECKSPGAAGFAILHQVNAAHLPERLEQIVQLAFCGLKT